MLRWLEIVYKFGIHSPVDQFDKTAIGYQSIAR
jgi:hypothetical protein